mmetsp:Transcript_2649/g.9378  ORF Transcript_2649/g.9378 Transcript_2649/m.9378 type:complete len:512 (-) Transcript_2649:22-1557(-)
MFRSVAVPLRQVRLRRRGLSRARGRESVVLSSHVRHVQARRRPEHGPGLDVRRIPDERPRGLPALAAVEVPAAVSGEEVFGGELRKRLQGRGAALHDDCEKGRRRRPPPLVCFTLDERLVRRPHDLRRCHDGAACNSLETRRKARCVCRRMGEAHHFRFRVPAVGGAGGAGPGVPAFLFVRGDAFAAFTLRPSPTMAAPAAAARHALCGVFGHHVGSRRDCGWRFGLCRVCEERHHPVPDLRQRPLPKRRRQLPHRVSRVVHQRRQVHALRGRPPRLRPRPLAGKDRAGRLQPALLPFGHLTDFNVLGRAARIAARARRPRPLGDVAGSGEARCSRRRHSAHPRWLELPRHQSRKVQSLARRRRLARWRPRLRHRCGPGRVQAVVGRAAGNYERTPRQGRGCVQSLPSLSTPRFRRLQGDVGQGLDLLQPELARLSLPIPAQRPAPHPDHFAARGAQPAPHRRERRPMPSKSVEDSEPRRTVAHREQNSTRQLYAPRASKLVTRQAGPLLK